MHALIFENKHDICAKIWKQILYDHIFLSIANLKCAPSDSQIYP